MNAIAVTTPAELPKIDLAELLHDRVTVAPVRVRRLRVDSRFVAPGDAFIALPGRGGHGLDYVESAARAGAVAVLFDASRESASVPAGVRGIAVPGLERDFAQIADRAYRSPSAGTRVLAVTGTNGKTTTAWLLAGAYRSLGEPGGYIGTLGEGSIDALRPASHTTPDVFSLQASLRDLVDAGAAHVAMEVSSQGLDQQRTDGVRIYAAAFTNLTRDHLDYHGTMEAYEAAKRRLFATPGLRHAVINVASEAGPRFAAAVPPGVEVTTVGARVDGYGGFVCATRIVPTGRGIEITGDSHAGPFTLQARLVGAFNAENILVALGLMLADGIGPDRAAAALSKSAAPPGRMEQWRLPNGVLVIVDYAHTPDALAKALESLRPHCRGALWCLFGCGGDRDKGKRPAMGAVAERLANRIVLTDDNPRSEESAAIIADILAGLEDPKHARVEPDRTRAIVETCASAVQGDIVLVAGMGHEEGQIYGVLRRPHSDRAVVAALAGAAP